VTWNPRRILIVGVTGSGKSTLGRAIEARTGIPHIEMDALHWGEGWTERPQFRTEARAAAASDAWVAELQYTRVLGALFLERADTLVWLDLPPWVSLTQLTRRTVRSWRRREMKWGVVREPAPWTILTDDEHIIRWWFRTWRKPAQRVPRYAAEHPQLQVVRLRSRREVREWVDRLASALRADG